jgi:hypothetical protein
MPMRFAKRLAAARFRFILNRIERPALPGKWQGDTHSPTALGRTFEKEVPIMKRSILLLCSAAMLLNIVSTPARAEMTNEQKAAAAIAILGIAALAHNKTHYQQGYAPTDGEQTAEFERGYRDAVHGYTYDERNGTRDYASGYEAGTAERENAVAHRKNNATGQKAPPMALQGCAEIVAQNFAVDTENVHFIKQRSPGKHEWEIEAAVGHQHMVCKMRDSGEVIELRGGRL